RDALIHLFKPQALTHPEINYRQSLNTGRLRSDSFKYYYDPKSKYSEDWLFLRSGKAFGMAKQIF
ncbi:hypothetical protein OFC17_31200, partial [Escherichia coli]|nr:hypothetical protein [Escherichia coli]